MTSREQPPGQGAASDSPTLAKVVARQRAEIVDLQRVAALMPVLERAKGAIMVQEGCSAQEAYETLLERSATAGRTLVEECWLTLGAIRPARRRRRRRRETGRGGSVFSSTQYLVPAESAPPSAAPGTDREATLLGRLGLGLASVEDHHDLARCLLEHLCHGVEVGAVLIYVGTEDGVRLSGHAGIDSVEAVRWHRLTADGRSHGHDPLRSHRPLWSEGPEAPEAYAVPEETLLRWPSRAWLPVDTGGEVEEVVTVLRGTDRAFTPAERSCWWAPCNCAPDGWRHSVRACRAASRPWRACSRSSTPCPDR